MIGPGRRSGKIEIYDSGRYFTVTGQHVAHDGSSVENRQVQLNNLLSEIFRRDEIAPTLTTAVTLFASNEELIERAKGAKNGDLFRRLWVGDIVRFGQ